MADLIVQDVVKRFGRVTALDGMSFEVREGEFYCLLGPSSAGKTTMLRAISGLEQLDGGRILFGGRDMAAAPIQGRGIAMIFQTFALYPHLTVRGNFTYPLERAGLPAQEIRTRVGEVAELLRVGHTLDRLPSTLSGGEQQRVAIGRALVRRPQLLLLDEPLTNLDAKLRHDTRAEFKRLHRELGMTMLYATPDQLEALTMGQRVGVMQAGRVVQVDTPRNLYAAPQDTYVAGMVGSPAINLVPGRIQRRDGAFAVDLPFGTLPADAWRIHLSGGEPVLFGVRPHDVLLGHHPARGPAFTATVHLTEPLGDVTLLDLDVNGAAMKMALPEERALGIGPGMPIEVTLSAADVHLFHAETGVRIA
ncbi:ABC transporter ATP-binding protein [Geminicoccus flavidas]|uniref:ABC transporter ATP-binding protein n=1 Tax=Geminicoccus flavidas TaxID=2506407 RepID=UPI00190FABA9|nr:ABC transporter ATP-binding protein [Geminicoccus flavidas]